MKPVMDTKSLTTSPGTETNGVGAHGEAVAPGATVAQRRQGNSTVELVRLLESPVKPETSGSSFGTFAMGVLSFGIFPLWRWNRRLRERMINQQMRLRQVAQWLQWKTGRPEAMALTDLADRAGWRWGLGMSAILCLPVILGFFIYYFSQVSPLSLKSAVAMTYQFRPLHRWVMPDNMGTWFFMTWTVGLCLGYLLHAVQLQRHAADLRRFAAGVNRFLAAEAQRPLGLPRLGTGLSVLSVIGALILLHWGAAWGIIMMLSGLAARRFERGPARRLNRELELMVRALDAGEIDAKLPRTCRKPRCGMILPAAARFCPRCGTRVGAQLNEVA